MLDANDISELDIDKNPTLYEMFQLNIDVISSLLMRYMNWSLATRQDINVLELYHAHLGLCFDDVFDLFSSLGIPAMLLLKCDSWLHHHGKIRLGQDNLKMYLYQMYLQLSFYDIFVLYILTVRPRDTPSSSFLKHSVTWCTTYTGKNNDPPAQLTNFWT